MREIKFRAWDYSKKIFLPTKTYAVLSVTEFGATGIMLTDFEEYREGEYFYPHSQVINQYTGLKDKNGKEIYEGDIILWDYEKIVVSYGIQGVDAFEGIGYNLWSHYGQKQDGTRLQSEIEVIGNIYENPELLNND